jgi:hypothetical protein
MIFATTGRGAGRVGLKKWLLLKNTFPVDQDGYICKTTEKLLSGPSRPRDPTPPSYGGPDPSHGEPQNPEGSTLQY